MKSSYPSPPTLFATDTSLRGGALAAMLAYGGERLSCMISMVLRGYGPVPIILAN